MTSPNISINKVTIYDIERLQKIGRQTFEETFTVHNTAENMQHYLKEGFSKNKLTSEINNPDSEFYFAEHDNQVIGYLKLNSGQSQTERQDQKALEIERIYVEQAFHGKGVGQLLYDKAIEVAQQKEVDYVWLGVWEKNTKAIRFYKKNGFTAFGTHIFKLGDDEQTDIMMKLAL